MNRGDPIQCNRCGYDLVGLGARGECPECGNGFDIERYQGIRVPGSPLEYSDFVNMMIRMALLGVVAASFFTCIGVWTYMEPSPRPIMTGLIGGTTIGLFFAINYLSWKKGR